MKRINFSIVLITILFMGSIALSLWGAGTLHDVGNSFIAGCIFYFVVTITPKIRYFNVRRLVKRKSKESIIEAINNYFFVMLMKKSILKKEYSKSEFSEIAEESLTASLTTFTMSIENAQAFSFRYEQILIKVDIMRKYVDFNNADILEILYRFESSEMSKMLEQLRKYDLTYIKKLSFTSTDFISDIYKIYKAGRDFDKIFKT